MDCMRMLNTKRLLSLFVGVLMIGTVSLTTFNSSSNTCVSYADDEGWGDVVSTAVGNAGVVGGLLGAAGAVVAGPEGAAVGTLVGSGIGAVAGAVTQIIADAADHRIEQRHERGNYTPAPVEHERHQGPMVRVTDGFVFSS